MLAGSMKSPWDEDARRPQDHDLFRDKDSNELLGQILERSTSAPPLASERNDDIVGGSYNEADTESVSEPHSAHEGLLYS